MKELTADGAEIRWKVSLANQKSSWYEFQLALDIPEAADAPPSLLRNGTVSDRGALTISPGSRRISGTEQSGQEYVFGDGEFMGKKVDLGELRTDEKGRLIVLGGHGVSASYEGGKAVTFAALYTGLRGGEAVLAALDGLPGAVQGYADRLTEIRRAYRYHHHVYYRQEGRWPEQSFWARRQRPSAYGKRVVSMRSSRDPQLVQPRPSPTSSTVGR